MTEPAHKDAAVEQGLEALFGRTSAIRADRCTSCGEAATEFKDALSRKEYTLSGLCQECQDRVFTEPDAEICDECGAPYREDKPLAGPESWHEPTCSFFSGVSVNDAAWPE